MGYFSFGKDSLRLKHIRFVGVSQIQTATGNSTSKNLTVTEVYVRRARKCLAKDMRVNWTTDLDVETLETRRSWATNSEVQSVIAFNNERYLAVLKKSIPFASSVTPGDLSFATRFVTSYLFFKVKGCRPMTYQYLTLRMFESARKNDGMVDQKIFKTAKYTVSIACISTRAPLKCWQNTSTTSDLCSIHLANTCW